MRRILTGAFLFLTVAIVFSGSVPNGFVRFDDYEYIVSNPHIREGLDAESAKWSFTAAGYAANWHPLTWLSHAADISLACALDLDWREPENDIDLYTRDSGSLPMLVHAENVLLHALCAVLLFCLLLALLRKCGGGSPVSDLTVALLTLLWALHPLRVEVVAWASERKELLSVLFMLLTLLAYVKRRYFAAIPLFALALFAKPVAVTLPVIVFAYDWILRREPFRRCFLRALPFGVLAVVASVLTVVSQDEALHGAGDWTLVNRLLAPVEAPVVYLGQTFWPVGLTIDYAVPDWSTWPVFAAGLLLVAALVATGVWYLVWRFRGKENAWLSLAAFAIVWVYIGLLPMLGVVKVGNQPHSDRYTYWIGCGAAAALVLALSRLPRNGRFSDSSLHLPLAIVLLVLSLVTFRLTRTWKDSETLLTRAVMSNFGVGNAQVLAEVMAVKTPQRLDWTVDMLRTVLERRRTPVARAVLAYQLAAYAPGVSRTLFDGKKTSPFAEARMLADFALEDHPRDRTAEFACAAIAFADYREGKYESALTWMNRAIECGFVPKSHNVNLGVWKEKANVPK